MAQDYGVVISGPGNSVNGAKIGQLVMNTSNPFLKIDTQNPVGFQTINLLITTDPPAPALGGNSFVILHKFEHEYDYAPGTEMLCFVQSAPPSSVDNMAYFQDWGIVGQNSDQAAGIVYCISDAEWVYIMCKKQSGFTSPNILLTGTNLLISIHVFVENVNT